MLHLGTFVALILFGVYIFISQMQSTRKQYTGDEIVHILSSLCRTSCYICWCFTFWNTQVNSQILWGSCCLIFSFLCSVLYFIVCPFVVFSCGHCVVCPSIYSFWLPLWYLQTSLRSPLHSLMCLWKNMHESGFIISYVHRSLSIMLNINYTSILPFWEIVHLALCEHSQGS